MRNLIVAVRPVLWDSLGVIVFAVLTALHARLALAVVFGTIVAIGILAWNVVRGRRIGVLEWISLALVVASGGAALLMHDARFVALKPSMMYGILGILLLRRGWMVDYVPPRAVRWVLPMDAKLLDVFGWQWALLMFVTAGANAIVAVAFRHSWPTFIGLFPLLSKLSLFGVQYAILRRRVRERITLSLSHVT